jgi:hypothetical protein
VGRREKPDWEETHHYNTDAAIVGNIDVVFYGDSITEGWIGTSYGRPKGSGENSREVFDNLFSTQNGGEFDGLALGIGGDSVRRSGSLKSMNDLSFLSSYRWAGIVCMVVVVGDSRRTCSGASRMESYRKY